MASIKVYRFLQESEPEPDPIDAVIFVAISLALGIACRHLLRGTRVPYTVALLLLGIALGALEYGTKHQLGRIGDGIRLWSHIDPDLLLAVFLPALLFESSFAMEVHQIKRCMLQMFLLAGPGVLISTIFLGSSIKLIFPYGWSWKTSLLLGGLLSATDPVAVVALLKELGASKKLSTIIEGESLMNDGTAIVVYQLFLRMVLGWTFDWGGIIKFLVQVSLGALGIGLAFGITSVLWLGFIFNDTVIEITLTLAVSYIAYFTAQVGADISGVLTVMTLGMFYAAYARTAFKGESQESLHNFWEMVAYIANTLIFILSGVVIAEGVFVNDSILKTHENSWGYLFLLYVLVQISRVVVVGALFPFLRYFGYGLDLKEATILVWSGLRGAVALSLSLSEVSRVLVSVKLLDNSNNHRSSDNSTFISPDTGTLFVFLTGGIVFLTLIVNGSSTQFVLRMLNMDKLSAAKWRILKYTKFEMLNKALEAFGDLGEDEELGPADWPAVKKYISSLDDVDGERIHPHNSSGGSDNLDNNLTDIRVRFLNGVQAAYWEMLDEGRIDRTTANLMMQSVDEALDMISHEALCDWKGLSSNVNIPNYYKFLQTSMVPRKLVTHFIVERLESACCICAAFLRAHRIARIQLHDFIGNSETASLVIKESEDEEEEPKKFLEEVRVSFPEVLRVVKTRQVTYSVLSHLSDYVQKLEKIGLLEEKEMVHLHDAVQTDMKKLLRNPPLVKIPTLRDLIQDNPLLGALPSDTRETLLGSTKETIKLRDAIIYKEGSKPNSIWIISNGVVKWSSKGTSNKLVLHPTFTHRSTLGLYEVLAGKPYICDVVTDTVVLCLSVEAEKIHAAIRSNPTVEDFFWRESTITLSKVLLPQVFEKFSMHELRTVIAERSSIYIRGETFEIPQHFVGFLLEGFVKSQGIQEELITSPAALGSSDGDQSYQRSETSGTGASSSSHRALWYQSETRTRIILCDIAGVETRTLPRKPTLPKPHATDHSSGSLARVHSGLMSWPEQYFDLRQRKNADIEKADGPKNNLSARAMQLNIYGSMVEGAGWHAKGLLRSTKSQPPHSHSYPSILLNQMRPLVAAKSEGAIVRKVEATEGKYPTQNPGLAAGDDDLSDDSGPEEEHLHLIRIDSPSGLSFRNER